MRSLIRYRVRSILIAATAIAVLCACLLVPTIERKREIRRLGANDVFIVTVVREPVWLPRMVTIETLFEVPISAQVLLRPINGAEAYLLGRIMTYEEARNELTILRTRLRDRLGIDHFVLVEGGTIPPEAGLEILKLCAEFETILTPCGITNFNRDTAL